MATEAPVRKIRLPKPPANPVIRSSSGPPKMLMPFWWKPLPEADYVVKYPYGPISKFKREMRLLFLKENRLPKWQYSSYVIWAGIIGIVLAVGTKQYLSSKPKPKGADHHHDALFPVVHDWVLKNLETYSKKVRQMKEDAAARGTQL